MSNIEVLKKSDFVDLDDKFFLQTESTLEKFNLYVKLYVYYQDVSKYKDKLKSILGEDTHIDESNVLQFMEKLKVEHFAYLNSFLDSYSKILGYKENFEFLSAERKALKSRVISKIMANNKEAKSSAAAEKLVYADEEYQEGLKEIQELKEYFIKIENAFELQKDLSKNLYQTISNFKHGSL